MQIDTIKNFGDSLILNKNYYRWIDFSNNNIGSLLTDELTEHKKRILDNINSINNQNIQDIDFNSFKYKHWDTWISFSELSKAERVFMLSTVADILHVKIWLHTDMTQLTKTTIKKFLRLFSESEYVNIVITSELSRAFYSVMMKEVKQ